MTGLNSISGSFKTAVLISISVLAFADSPPAVQLSLDLSEAEQALRIMQTNRKATPEDWRQHFATTPYQQLKAREAAMGRAFTDEEFQKFLLSPEALAKLPDWQKAFGEMKQSDMSAIGEGVLKWLPAGASIHARVFPEIKPSTNSFVWTAPGGEPAIFLYIGKQTRDQFENTVSHECHHIGLDSLTKQQEAVYANLPPNVKLAVMFLGAFGEGEAILAAAGSERHPHWEDDAPTRARWDGDLMHFNTDLAALEQLFTEILDGKLKDEKSVMEKAAPFWGDAQGAWYTVGYEMSALVEKAHGRQAFVDFLIDPRKLLAAYNQIAHEANAKGATLATWSPTFLNRLGD